jgi:hypothetical protein
MNMKKPLTMPEEAQPRNITRADLVLIEGFGLEVDGRMKTVFPTLQAAEKKARAVKAEFPMLETAGKACWSERATPLRPRIEGPSCRGLP